MLLHNFCERRAPSRGRVQMWRPTDVSDVAMAERQQILDALANAFLVIDDNVADVRTNFAYVEKDQGNLFVRQPPAQADIHLGGHDSHASHVLLKHALDGPYDPLWIVVRVGEDDVVTVRAGLLFYALDQFREERIVNVRDDQAEDPAVTGRQAARVDIRRVVQHLDRGLDLTLYFFADESRVVYDMRDRRGRHPGKLGDIFYFHSVYASSLLAPERAP